MVRSLLEYITHLQVWSPHKISDIHEIERVQRKATKILAVCKRMSYEDRLRYLNLPTMKYRRLRGDMIRAYKIITD